MLLILLCAHQLSNGILSLWSSSNKQTFGQQVNVVNWYFTRQCSAKLWLKLYFVD